VVRPRGDRPLPLSAARPGADPVRLCVVDGPLGIVLFTAGWMAGWVLLARPRPLPTRRPSDEVRPRVSVIVPARDEAVSIGGVVATAVAQLRPGDEVLVVDDHSSDGTSGIARRAGARVVHAPDLPPGWAGKPHACHVGAGHASGDVLVFLDADVMLGAGALDAVVGEVTRADGRRLVSVQPWHRPGSAVEQLQLVCNVVALMGTTAFTPLGHLVHPRVAFGPVLASTRAGYEQLGGHAHPTVRGAVLEDIALARLADDVMLFTGRAPRGGDGATATTSFRMYPGGWRPMVEGWTKGMGIGASATPWWARVLVGAWIASLAAGWVASPWLVLASIVQLAVLGRVAGRWSWWVVVGYPLALGWFVAVVLRSAWRRAARRDVSWKGRRLTPDQPTR